MIKPIGILITCLGILLTAQVQGSDDPATPLPGWESLEFEEKAFWATANSLLTVRPDAEDKNLWDLEVESSVVSNSEQVNVIFDPATGKVVKRSRLSRGSGQRMKSYVYEEESVLRERRDQPADTGMPPQEWPVSSTKHVPYPAAATDMVLTSPYLLILLAQRLQALGLEKSTQALVLTDQNFYRVHLSSGRGIPIEVDYTVDGSDKVSGRRDTRAVAVQVAPEGELVEDNDFSLLGLQENIILFFDSESGLPLQARGKAPRIGDTNINLRAVTMRRANQ